MRRVTRDDVSTPYSTCKKCGCKTRSHELEAAEYEIFVEEVIIGSSDTYAAKRWEEVDEVEKYERVTEPVVMCHKCWLQVQASFVKMVKKNFDNWNENISSNVSAVKKAINTQVYYDFEDEDTIGSLKTLAKTLKEAALDGR